MIPTKGQIPLTDVKLPAWYVRGRSKKDHVQQMVDACRAAGPKGRPLWILPPIEIRHVSKTTPPKKNKGKPTVRTWLELIDGRHRMLACETLKLPKIPYLLKSLSDEAASLRQVETNLDGKVALTTEDKHRAIRDLLAQHIQAAKIAVSFHMHRSTISLIGSGKIGTGKPHGNIGKKRGAKPAPPSNGIAEWFTALNACHVTLTTMMREKPENTHKLVSAARENEKRNTFLLTFIHDLSALAGLEDT